MKKDMNGLGELLGMYRYRVQKLTQEQLGHLVEVSDTTVRNWENGRSVPNVQHLKKLIAVYLDYNLFEKGKEREEAENLWQKANLFVAFDDKWFDTLIAAHAEPAIQSTTSSDTPALKQAFSFNIPLQDPMEFHGRARERITLLERTTKRGSTSIRGPRRIGKTWLISYLIKVAGERLGAQFHTIYLDATQTSCATVSEFVVSVLRKLDISLPEHTNADLIKLEQTIADFDKKNQTVVLCIDEFEGFSNKEEFAHQFFASLRAMTSQGLVLVVTSKTPLKDFIGESGRSSGFFNIFEDLSLEAFDFNEANDFVQTKAREVNLSPQEQEFLLKYGQEGGKWPPLRLQLVGKLLLEDKRLSHDNPQFHYALEDPAYLRQFDRRFTNKYPGTISK